MSISGKWYRGRTASSSEVYESKDMQAPPIGRARDGRYHHNGQSFLYIADNRETAIGEVLDDYYKPGLVWIQDYEIGGINKILDLRSDWNRIGMTESAILVALLSRRLLDQKVQDRKSNWKPEYFVTRFIADCARLAGYNGIMYSSTRYTGDNAILFDVTTTLIKPVGDPIILVHKPSFNYKVDFTDSSFPF
ncbi:MAG: RES family NAD+ phosphorylase [Desulfitobacterium hafniense]|nr:RES family NAD+ phosphorylase [Desulfitobacterium hafniense]